MSLTFDPFTEEMAPELEAEMNRIIEAHKAEKKARTGAMTVIGWLKREARADCQKLSRNLLMHCFASRWPRLWDNFFHSEGLIFADGKPVTVGTLDEMENELYREDYLEGLG